MKRGLFYILVAVAGLLNIYNIGVGLHKDAHVVNEGLVPVTRPNVTASHQTPPAVVVVKHRKLRRTDYHLTVVAPDVFAPVLPLDESLEPLTI